MLVHQCASEESGGWGKEKEAPEIVESGRVGWKKTVRVLE